MKTLSNLFTAFVCMVAITTSCSKNSSDDQGNNIPVYKISSITSTDMNGVVETDNYSYKKDTITNTFTFSNEPGIVYTKVFTKEGNLWNSVNKRDGIIISSQKTFIYSDGKIDSIISLRGNGSVNSTAKYTYNNNYTVNNIVDFITYKHNYTYYYNNGNYSYWIDNFTHNSNPALNKVDSIAFEFYPNLQFTKPYKPYPFFEDGKQCKNLIKKKSFYNLTTGATLYRTDEYQYEVDSRGLVTKELYYIYTQPGNVLFRSVENKITYLQQ